MNPNSKFILAAKKTNKSIKETPVTISGLIIGILVTFIIRDFGSFFILCMPIAARVPRIVEAMLARVAIIIVFIKDEIIILLLNKRSYQSKVKPLKTERLFVSLNEKTISTKIGTYRNIKTRAIYTFPSFFMSFTSH